MPNTIVVIDSKYIYDCACNQFDNKIDYIKLRNILNKTYNNPIIHIGLSNKCSTKFTYFLQSNGFNTTEPLFNLMPQHINIIFISGKGRLIPLLETLSLQFNVQVLSLEQSTSQQIKQSSKFKWNDCEQLIQQCLME